MSKKTKQKKIAWHKYIPMAFGVFIGGICGVMIGSYMDQTVASDTSLGEEIFSLASLVLFMYVAMLVQTIIHEAGHLVFGLLSGYHFCSFRIMSFMWMKEGNKIKFRRYYLAGTDGQCLMTPPDLVDGKMPVMLYNLGGSMMNVIASALFLILYFLFRNIPLLKTMMLIFAIVGLLLAVMNGVPMRLGMVNNDGYHAFALTRNKEALRSLWIELKVGEQIVKGVRIKDMPEDWFEVPSDEDMKNTLVADVGVFACNRLMDEQKFEEADKIMEHFLGIESGIIGLHRSLMVCDRMYCEMISKNRKDVLGEMYSKELKKFMKQMKTFPSVIRTEYTYALLSEKDQDKAQAIKERFEKCARTYPYPGDIQSERELMGIADELFSKV